MIFYLQTSQWQSHQQIGPCHHHLHHSGHLNSLNQRHHSEESEIHSLLSYWRALYFLGLVGFDPFRPPFLFPLLFFISACFFFLLCVFSRPSSASPLVVECTSELRFTLFSSWLFSSLFHSFSLPVQPFYLLFLCEPSPTTSSQVCRSWF